MTRRARRGIDMLPLLDVFMVVLFVFATIQEHAIDDGSQTIAGLERELAALQAKHEAASAREAELVDALALAQAEATTLREADVQLAEYRRVCGEPKPEGPLCPAIELEPKTAAEQLALDTLLARLFDNVAVFEVELEGEPDLVRGVLVNHCCYRSDPPQGEWRGCGDMPSSREELERWVADGGEGLIEALRRTRGGNAIVLLRQGSRARYRMTNDLSDALRETLPEHRVYDDGQVDALDCPLLGR